MLGAQAALELNQHFHLVSSLSWSHGHNRYLTLDRDLTYIWQYDVGFELNMVEPLPHGALWRPFIGLGGGGRTYDYRSDGLGTRTCSAGYGSVGSEVEARALALRLEARGFLNCFEHPISAKKQTRGDLGLALGIAYHVR